MLLPVVFNCGSGRWSIKGRVAMVITPAYTKAAGNGECFVVVDVHQAHLCGCIGAEVVGIHEACILIDAGLKKCAVEMNVGGGYCNACKGVQVIGQLSV